MKKKLAALSALSVTAGAANAALPTALNTAFADFQTDALSLIDKGWPLLIAVFGGMLFMKLFKKIANKST